MKELIKEIGLQLENTIKSLFCLGITEMLISLKLKDEDLFERRKIMHISRARKIGNNNPR